MSDWWSLLSFDLQIFFLIALVSTLFLIVQAILMLIGFGGDEGGADDVAEGGLRILSVRTVVAFFVGFGWGGVIALRSGQPLVWAIGIAILIGGAFMMGVLVLMRALYGLRGSGTLDYKNAVGRIGTVYMKVPAHRDHAGQVEVMIQGRLAIIQAYTEGDEDIPAAAKVKVVGLLDRQSLLVEPL